MARDHIRCNCGSDCCWIIWIDELWSLTKELGSPETVLGSTLRGKLSRIANGHTAFFGKATAKTGKRALFHALRDELRLMRAPDQPSFKTRIDRLSDSFDAASTDHRRWFKLNKVEIGELPSQATERILVMHWDERVLREQLADSAEENECFSHYKYVGLHGARRWRDLERTKLYQEAAAPDYVIAKAVEALRGRSFSTFVSLGPGVGIADLELLDELTNSGKAINEYIPVDISHGLAAWAHYTVGSRFNSHSPVVGDIEHSMRTVIEIVSQVTKNSGGRCWSLIGNTLGNFPDGDRFLRDIGANLSQKDIVLLHVSTINRDYIRSDDRIWRLLVDDLTVLTRDQLAFVKAFRSFISFPYYRTKPEDYRSWVDEFSKKVTIRPTRSLEIRNEDGFVEFSFAPSEGQSKPNLLTVRRFRVEWLLSEIEKVGLKLLSAKPQIDESYSGGIGHAVLVIGKE